jgi:hypothetical protein
MPLGMSWHDYNDSLVERGRILFELDFTTSWKDEVETMNREKVGRPYAYPNSYIEFLSFLKVGFDITYRTVEGITQALSEYVSFIRDIHFTQIRRRMLSLMKGKKPSEMAKVDAGEEPMTIVVDSSGLSTTNKGSYIEDKWKKEKRKYVKLHLVADKKTGKIVGFRVTSEKTADTKKFVPPR